MSFDVVAARRRCRAYRRRILDISQQVTALHAAGAFSCLEIVDVIPRTALGLGKFQIHASYSTKRRFLSWQ